MNTNSRQNFRIQVWYEAVPDKILLSTISVCAEDPEMALQLARAHTRYQLISVENLFWRVQESAAEYKV